MAIVDPTKFDSAPTNTSASTTIRKCGAGKKLLVPVGFEHRDIKGKPVVDIRYVCIQDFEEGGDEGAIATDTFWLNAEALWRIGRWANAMGRKEPFDPEDGDDLTGVMAIGPVEATIRIEENGEYVNQKFDKGCYSKHSCEIDPTTNSVSFSKQQQQYIQAAEKAWSGYLKWRSENPRYASGQSPVNGTNEIPKPVSDPYASDEIPF